MYIKHTKTILLLAAVVSLTSCAAIKKAKTDSRESKISHAEAKKDSTATVKKDSTATVKTHLSNTTVTTEVIDTTFLVGADSMSATGNVPDTGQTQVFADGDITTEVGVDGAGRLTVKTKVKPRPVTVFKTRTTASTTTQDIEARTESRTEAKTAIKSSATIDSTVRRKSALKSKDIKRPAGVVTISIILLILVAVICIIVRARKRIT